MMKLSVPYFKSKKDTDCGPLALKMALEYLGESHPFQLISEYEKQIETGLVWSVGIARASKKFGFPTKFISTSNFNPEENDIEYYKKYSNNNAMLVLKKLSDEIKEIGVEIQEKNMPLEELLTFVSDDSIPIVLINWYVISGKDGFSGHFLPVTGYDEHHVYVHNPGMKNAQEFLPIARDIFLKAWESKGTDKDTIIISRKTKPHK